MNCQKCRQPLLLSDSLSSLQNWDDIVSASLASHPSTVSSTPSRSSHPQDLSRVPPSLRPLYSAAVQPRLVTSKPSPVQRVVARHPPPPPLNESATFPLPAATRPPHPKGPAESFVVLTESVIQPARTAVPPSPPEPTSTPDTLSTAPPPSQQHNEHNNPITPHLAQLKHLYSLISQNTQVEQPLCLECCDLLLSLMAKELDEGKKERDRLVGFEREIARKRDEAAKSEGGPVTRQGLESDIAKWEKKAVEATAELKTLEADRLVLEQEEAKLDEEEAALADEEAAFWREHAKHSLEEARLRDDLASLANRKLWAERDLERLARTNVYNDAFCIGHEAGFGTINKLRLGRLPGIPVDWPEINAAWGHTLLLLQILAKKFAYTFDNYKLVPLGSFSRVEKTVGDRAVYELYGSGDFNALSRVLQNRRFDQAMVAFLDCLRQLMEHVKALDKTVKLPHAVVKDKIGDVSIKYQFGSDEAWTRALRHVLFDLKILLGRASA